MMAGSSEQQPPINNVYFLAPEIFSCLYFGLRVLLCKRNRRVCFNTSSNWRRRVSGALILGRREVNKLPNLACTFRGTCTYYVWVFKSFTVGILIPDTQYYMSMNVWIYQSSLHDFQPRINSPFDFWIFSVWNSKSWPFNHGTNPYDPDKSGIRIPTRLSV